MEESSTNLDMRMQEPFRFGPFVYESRQLKLIDPRKKVRLQPQVAYLLEALAEKAGDFVRKEELRLKVWPRGGVPMEWEAGLYSVAKKLRNKFEFLKAGTRDLIETIPDVGYKLDAEVTAISVSGKCIALLEFKSSDSTAEFSAALRGCLLHRLHRADLEIVSPLKSDQIPGSRLFDYELNGSVNPIAAGFFISANVLHSGTRAVVWAFAKNAQDGEADDVAQSMATQIHRKLGRTPESTPGSETRNIQAFEQYKKGRELWVEQTRKSIRECIGCFEKAVQLDSRYVLAHAAMANAYLTATAIGEYAPRRALDKCIAHASKADELSSGCVEGLVPLHWAKAIRDHLWIESELAVSKLLERDPNNAVAAYAHSYLALALGQVRFALRDALRAAELEPQSPIFEGWKTFMWYLAGDCPEAIAVGEPLVDRKRLYPFAGMYLGLAYLANKMVPQALVRFDSAVENSRNPVALLTRAHAYAVIGKENEARKTLKEMLVKTGFVPHYDLALVYTALQDYDHAINCLFRACKDREFSIGFLKTDPRLSPITSHPRFSELLHHCKLSAKSPNPEQGALPVGSRSELLRSNVAGFVQYMPTPLIISNARGILWTNIACRRAFGDHLSKAGIIESDKGLVAESRSGEEDWDGRSFRVIHFRFSGPDNEKLFGRVMFSREDYEAASTDPPPLINICSFDEAIEASRNAPIESLMCFLEQLPATAGIKSLVGEFLWYNKAYQDLAHAGSLEELIGKTSRQIFNLPDNKADGHHQTVIDNKAGVLATESVLMPGRVCRRRNLRFPVLDKAGNVIYLGGVNTTIEVGWH